MSRSSIAGEKSELKKLTIMVAPCPLTPEGKKRCHNCDQPFAQKKQACPHCKAAYSVPLSEIDPTLSADCITDEDWAVFEKDVKRLRTKTHIPESRLELQDILFKHGMAVRYTHPKRSLDLFMEVIALDPDHWEARIKISWLQIRVNDFLAVMDSVTPVVEPEASSTIEQKQRAYNNIVCSYLFRFPMDLITAEKVAREGIALDARGNVKLWENLGSALKHQHRYDEARDAFNTALTIEPKSEFAIKNLRYLYEDHKHNNNRKTDKENVVGKKGNLFSSFGKKGKTKPVDRI